MVGLYERITNENLLVRKINVTANNVQSESDLGESNNWEQLSLFADEGQVAEAREDVLEKERQAQEALLKIQKKYGKNAILKGMNLLKGATTKDQNKRIGGHKA
jgi:DNA polymerase V